MIGLPPSELRTYPPYLPEDRQAIISFLRSRELRWDEDITFSVACLVNGTLAGTGSLAGSVIKSLAVDESFRGEGLATRLISRLEMEAAARGHAHPFVFTLPRNAEIFQSLGYQKIGEVPGSVLLLEKGDGILRWLRELQQLAAGLSAQGPVSALVMNCNPITLGHLHLIRTAAEASGHVFLFVVAEDVSDFPAAVRLRLVQEATASLPNVTVLSGSAYLVSRATFPSYFLKGGRAEASSAQAQLDAVIFANRIAPAIGALSRFIAEEPYCPVTAAYNRVMHDVLPRHGIRVTEIPRLALGGEPISASRVRRCLREGRMKDALDLVPPTTAAFLASPAAEPVLAKLRTVDDRH
jgi:[citrate (pro-3S)-lyase] ligase